MPLPFSYPAELRYEGRKIWGVAEILLKVDLELVFACPITGI